MVVTSSLFFYRSQKNPHANRHEDFKNKTIQANAGIREPENYLSLGSFTSVGIFKPENRRQLSLVNDRLLILL
jgi:hypothetical protein